jgi:outer membrane protein assembly factor BamA
VLPYYASPDNFGIGTALEFQEPMRTHKFNISGLFSLDHPISKSYFFTKYTNNSFRPRLELHFNHFTSGALIIGRSRKVQMTNVVAASSLWKLSGLSQDFSDWYVGLQLRYMRFKYFSDERLHQKYPRFLYTNHAAHQTDLKAAVIWHNMKPSKNTFINPFSGAGVRLSVTGSDKILGSDTKYLRLNLGGYKILPGFGRNRIYLRLNGVMDLGAPAGRDYLNFASGGNFALTGPNFLGSVNPDINRFVRGYHKNILGDKFLFGRLEYRIPFEFNTTEKLFGVIPPARTVFTFFSDAGMMGNARVAPNRTATKRRWSAGFEIKRVLAAGGFQLAYEVGIGQPLTKAFGPHLYIRAQMAVPF